MNIILVSIYLTSLLISACKAESNNGNNINHENFDDFVQFAIENTRNGTLKDISKENGRNDLINLVAGLDVYCSAISILGTFLLDDVKNLYKLCLEYEIEINCQGGTCVPKLLGENGRLVAQYANCTLEEMNNTINQVSPCHAQKKRSVASQICRYRRGAKTIFRYNGRDYGYYRNQRPDYNVQSYGHYKNRQGQNDRNYNYYGYNDRVG